MGEIVKRMKRHMTKGSLITQPPLIKGGISLKDLKEKGAYTDAW